MNPDSKKLIVSCNITFVEDEFSLNSKLIDSQKFDSSDDYTCRAYSYLLVIQMKKMTESPNIPIDSGHQIVPAPVNGSDR